MFESNSRVALLCKSDYQKLGGLRYKSKAGDARSDERIAKLKTVKVIDDHLFPDDVARIGSVVGLKDLGTGSVTRLMLMDGATRPMAASSTFTTVALTSSLGMVLLGMRRGENIKWTLPNGHVRHLRISDLMPKSSVS